METKNPYECSACDSEDCSGCGEAAWENGFEAGKQYQASLDQLNFDEERKEFWKKIEEAKQEGMRKVVEWGNEDCPHTEKELGIICPEESYVPVSKRECELCWQAFLKDNKLEDKMSLQEWKAQIAKAKIEHLSLLYKAKVAKLRT